MLNITLNTDDVVCYGSPILASMPTSLSSRDTPFALLYAPSQAGRPAFRLSGVPPGYRALTFPILRRPCPLGRLLPLSSPL